MDHAHDAESDDDLDERLARVFEEQGIPKPPPRAAARPLPTPPTQSVPPVAPPVAPAPGPEALPKAIPQAPARPSPVAAKPAAPPVAPRRSGRREKTILLAMLGTLAGAFVGVLSMKLLVPRAPNGAGPDIHLESAGDGGLDLVEPPALTALPPAAAIPPDPFRSLGVPPAPQGDQQSSFRDSETTNVAAAIDAEPADAAPASGRFSRAPSSERLAPSAPPDLAPVPADAAPPASRFVDNPLRTSNDKPLPKQRAAFASAPDRFEPRGEDVVPAAATRPLDSRSAEGNVAALGAGGYVVREGDTWWSVAESTYGDGRLYKALFAWNRTLDPRVSLAPGTHLELPREEQLRAAWGRLVPTSAP
jgi:nucleoid-associated protein YgaU